MSNSLTNVLANIQGITTNSDINRIYSVLKDKVTSLNRAAAGRFRLNQSITISGYTGKIESIGKTGRVKIKLKGHWKYDSYTTGAQELVEQIEIYNSQMSAQQ
jgi:hypothetical protein